MATITKRNNGKYQVKCRRKGYKTQSKTFSTKATAERWARQVESEMDKSIFVSTTKAETMTVSEAFNQYYKERVSEQKSAQVTLCKINLIKKVIGHLNLFDVSVAILREYKSYRSTMVQGETVRKELLIIGRLFKHAIQEWEVHLPKGNPLNSVSLPKKAKSRDRRLEYSEKTRLLNKAKEYGGCISDIIEFAIETGMRRSEIESLIRANVCLKSQTAYLPDTKNDTSRFVPLSTRALEIIAGQELKGINVFNIRGDSIGQAFRRICKRVGIANLRFHDLRHEATSLFFEQGFSIMEVSTITGHKDLASLKRYTHMRAADIARKMA
jgi:integrase